jgi:diacylglycerol kinase family enzyme
MTTFGVILNPTSGKGKAEALGKAYVSEYKNLG